MADTYTNPMQKVSHWLQFNAELVVEFEPELDALLAESPMLPAMMACERSLRQNSVPYREQTTPTGILAQDSLGYVDAVLRVGRGDVARRLCLKALEWHPESHDLWSIQADVEEQLGNGEVAARLRHFATVSQEVPTVPEKPSRRELKAAITWTLFGGALIQQSYFKAARKALDHAYYLGKDDEDRELAMQALDFLAHLRGSLIAKLQEVGVTQKSMLLTPGEDAEILRGLFFAGDLTRWQ